MAALSQVFECNGVRLTLSVLLVAGSNAATKRRHSVPHAAFQTKPKLPKNFVAFPSLPSSSSFPPLRSTNRYSKLTNREGSFGPSRAILSIKRVLSQLREKVPGRLLLGSLRKRAAIEALRLTSRKNTHNIPLRGWPLHFPLVFPPCFVATFDCFRLEVRVLTMLLV